MKIRTSAIIIPAILYLLLFFPGSADAVTVSVSSNQSFCYTLSGPPGTFSFRDSGQSFSGLPDGTYGGSINSGPTGYTADNNGGCLTGSGSAVLNWAVTWTAVSAPPPPPTTGSYTVTLTISGSGTVTDGSATCFGPGTCTASYPANSTVTLTAGAGFTGWGGLCAGYPNPCSGPIAGNTSVTASFGTAPPPAPPPPAPPSTGTGLQYFGYWRESDFEDYVCEIQTHSNFSMIYGTLYNPLDIRPTDARFRETSNSGISSFGIYGPSALNGYIARDDADVPFDWAATKASIEAEIVSVKNAYPNAHPLINLAGRFRNISGFTLPNGIEWVGLECYAGLAECQSMFNALRPLLPANGRVWILLAGATFWGSDAQLTQRAQDTYNWARTESSIIGLISFVWQSSLVSPQVGTRDLPLLRAKMAEIGNAITGRNGGVSLSVCQSTVSVPPPTGGGQPPGGGGSQPPGGYQPPPGPVAQSDNAFENFTLQSVPRILSALACWFVRFALIAVGVFMIISGIGFVLSRGNPPAFANAKKAFFYALLGGLVIYGVYTIILTVSMIVTGSTTLPWVPLTCS